MSTASGIVVCVGHCTRDYIVNVAEIPKQPVKFRALDWTEIGGGLAATASVAVARLGGRAVFCGRIGDDDVGRAIRLELEGEGVNTDWLRTLAQCRSPRSMVLVDAQGERLLAAYIDQAFPSDADWLSPDLAGVLLVDLLWPAGAVRMLERARSMGLPSVVDADATARTGPDDVQAILERATHCIFSRAGLAQHSGHADITKGLIAIRDRHGGYVGVTDGESGYYWLERDRLMHIPARQIIAVDTNGAGDAFHGAFALGLARGQSEHEAADFANILAALKCTRPGGRAGLPTAKEVASFQKSM
jgi:sulfofructose kinase